MSLTYMYMYVIVHLCCATRVKQELIILVAKGGDIANTFATSIALPVKSSRQLTFTMTNGSDRPVKPRTYIYDLVPKNEMF